MRLFIKGKAGARLALIMTIVLLVPLVTLPLKPVHAVSTDFRQCANDDTTKGFSLGECHWINSILNSQNSMYFEGMSVAQRVILTSLPAGTSHSLVFEHEFTKGGTHAYDFLVGWNQGNSPPITVNECGPEIPASLTLTCALLLGSTPLVFNLDTGGGGDSFESFDGDAVACAASAVNQNVQTKINAFRTAIGDDRKIRIFAISSVTGATISVSHDVANCGDTGDSDVMYTLSWTTSGSTTSALIELAGHLAVTGPDKTGVNWGPGQGSSVINGGPYHFRLMTADGVTLGSQDNPIRGASILVPGKESPTIATVLSATLVMVGDSVTDSAILTGATSDAGGTVTYSVFTTSDCSDIPIFTSTKTVTNAVVPSSDPFTPGIIGTFNWQAFYSGDANNNPAISTCGTEALNVVAVIPEYDSGVLILIVSALTSYMLIRRSSKNLQKGRGKLQRGQTVHSFIAA